MVWVRGTEVHNFLKKCELVGFDVLTLLEKTCLPHFQLVKFLFLYLMLSRPPLGHCAAETKTFPALLLEENFFCCSEDAHAFCGASLSFQMLRNDFQTCYGIFHLFIKYIFLTFLQVFPDVRGAPTAKK